MASYIDKNDVVKRINATYPDVTVEVHDVIDSTNTRSSALLAQGVSPNLIISGQQTAGYGRLGRDYFSPEKSGIYLTYGFKIDRHFDKILHFTTHSAVALLKAMAPYIDDGLTVKWVNDIYYHQRKVSGILTQAQQNADQSLDITIGIGINFMTPTQGYPKNIAHKAGALFELGDDQAPEPSQFIVEVFDQLNYWLQIDNQFIGRQALFTYRTQQLLMHKPVTFGDPKQPEHGIVHGIADDYGLIIATAASNYKHEITLNYGEVNIISWQTNLT